MVSQEAVHELSAHRGYPGNHACSLRRETLKDVGVRKPKQRISYNCKENGKIGAAANRATEWATGGDERGPLGALRWWL